mmetsp:Transcript_116044/g.333267  ORF Transcript_116044/g.333267 Transcript_116044/m.333267 type:complete len:443 (+) Transcript_116044:64-1392(+)
MLCRAQTLSCCGSRHADYEMGCVDEVEFLPGQMALVMPDDLPPVRALILPMICVFQGYACMVGPAQQKFKAELGIGQSGQAALIFTQAAVFVHYGKLVARLGHEVLLGWLSPISRVYVAMGFVLVGTLIPPFFVFDLHDRWIGFVFVSYGLAGIGLGVFECTFLAVITPMGKLTKAWAIMGAPLGFGIVNILGLVCTTFGMPVSLLYWYIVCLIPAGMFVFWRCSVGLQAGDMTAASIAPGHGSGVPQKNLAASLLECGRWLPLVLPHLIAKMLVNFVMENATPVNYYVYNADQVPLLGPDSDAVLWRHDIFFAVLGVCVLLGDMVSRRVPASLTLAGPSSYIAILAAAVLCSVLGFYLESLAVAVLALVGIFLAFWGNGLVYGASAKFFDMSVPKEYNLVAYSMWCFLGDVGGIAGGVTVDIVRNSICGGKQYAFQCLSHN